jgi:hypothetical protein
MISIHHLDSISVLLLELVCQYCHCKALLRDIEDSQIVSDSCIAKLATLAHTAAHIENWRAGVWDDIDSPS